MMMLKRKCWKVQITQEERIEIYTFLREWLSFREMWRRLWRSHTSIGRELWRNSLDCWRWVIRYKPLIAEQKRLQRRLEANKNHIILYKDHEQRELLEKYLQDKWDSWWPDEILNRISDELDRKVISTWTFYRFVSAWFPRRKRYLRHKGVRYKKNDQRKKPLLIDIPLIHERSDDIRDRKRIGDREADTIVSNKLVKWWAVTLVDRKSRYTLLKKVKTLESNIVGSTMRYMLWNEKKKSVTTDNGKEFAWLKLLIKALNIDWFRCDPYSSYQRWTNEKTNWFIRRYLPKWVDINQYTDKEIQEIQDKLNHKPRKILWYKTPYEVYHNICIKYLT